MDEVLLSKVYCAAGFFERKKLRKKTKRKISELVEEAECQARECGYDSAYQYFSRAVRLAESVGKKVKGARETATTLFVPVLSFAGHAIYGCEKYPYFAMEYIDRARRLVRHGGLNRNYKNELKKFEKNAEKILFDDVMKKADQNRGEERERYLRQAVKITEFFHVGLNEK